VLALLKLEGSERILDIGLRQWETTAEIAPGSAGFPLRASMPPPT